MMIARAAVGRRDAARMKKARREARRALEIIRFASA
jgi:hypothetical protein